MMSKSCSLVPAYVLRDVERAVRGAHDLRQRIDATIANLDDKLGGRGRYEADAFVNCASEIGAVRRTIEAFRVHAPRNGIDPEAVLNELGGVPALEPSDRARAWMTQAQTQEVAPEEGPRG